MKLLSLRIPDELHEAIKALSEKEKRSLNSEILYILEEHLKRLRKKEKSRR